MSVHRHGGEQPRDRYYFYYACPECGWCGRLRDSEERAREDGVRHQAVKAQAKATG